MGILNTPWNQPDEFQGASDWRLVLPRADPTFRKPDLSKFVGNGRMLLEQELQQADVLLRLRSLAWGLARWRHYASKNRISRFAIETFERRKVRAASRALNRWWLFCDRQKQKAYVRKAKCILGQKVRYFKRWHRHVTALKSRRAECEMLAGDARFFGSSKAILWAWHAQAQRSFGYRRNLQRAMQSEVSCAADVFFHWRSTTEKQQELRHHREVSACIHMRRLRKKWVFDRLRTWQEIGRRLSHHDWIAQKHVLERWRRVTRLRRPFRLRLIWLGDALVRRMMLRAWWQLSGLEQRRRLLLHFCKERCASSVLRRAVQCWRAFKDAKLGCQASLTYKEELNALSLLSQMWRMWIFLVRRHGALAAAATTVVRQARRRLLHRCHSGVQHQKRLVQLLYQHMTRCISLALLGWSLFAAYKLLLRKRAEDAHRRRRVREAADSLLQWAAWARRSRGNKLAWKWMASKGFGSVLRRVFSTWRRATDSAAACRTAGKTSLRRLLHRAWMSWQLGCQKQQALRLRAAKVWQKRTVRVLLPWQRLTVGVRHCWTQSRAAQRAALSMALQDSPSTSRMMTFYRDHLLGAMLRGWCDETRRSASRTKGSLTVRKKALASAVRKSLRQRFWSRWRKASAWRAIDANFLQRAGKARRGPWQIWTAWRSFTQVRRGYAKHAEEVRQRCLRWQLQRHLTRWRLAGWSCWWRQRSQSCEIRGLLARWRHAVISSKKLQGMLAHRAVMEQGRLLQGILTQWHRDVRDQVMARAIRQKRRQLWASFLMAGWREECQRLRLLRVTLRCFQQHWQERSRDRGLSAATPCLAAWRRWTQKMSRNKMATKLLAKVSRSSTAILHQFAFAAWASLVQRRLAQHGDLRAVLAQQAARLLKRCIRSWGVVINFGRSSAKSLRSERAIVAWRLLLLNFKEYAA